MQHKLRPEDVRLGMYVCGFGGSWFGHPFWRAKFVLRNTQDLERVHASGVPYVIVDDSLGIGPEPLAEKAPRPAPQAAQPLAAVRIRQAPRRPNRQFTGWDEDDKLRERNDRQHARALLTRSMKVLRTAFADVRLGRAVRMDDVTSIVDDVVGTVERNPRTLLDMLRLKQKNEYTYMHSIAVCTLMVNVARHMGKPEAKVRDYGLAGLLHDLGKMGIPDTILNKEGRLTEAEFQAVRDHPEQGYQVLVQSPNMGFS
jgi:HD-GYP domain-containing protein (c-di-GMP phosphodiesterase class II)